MQIRIDNDIIHFILVLVIIPIQIIFLHYYKSDGSRQHTENKSDASLFIQVFYQLRYYAYQAYSYLDDSTLINSNGPPPLNSPRQIFTKPDGLFGSSNQIRIERHNIMYHVGMVVNVEFNNKLGVILGWDYQMQADKHWVQLNHQVLDNEPKKFITSPFYRVYIFDLADSVYLPEGKIKPASADSVGRPDEYLSRISDYFEFFDGSIFIPQKWLRKIYPFG